MKNLNKNAFSLILLFLMFLNTFQLFPRNEEQRKNELRAYFIFTIAQYIEWDNLSDSENFTIGIIGNSVLDVPLNKISAKKKVNNKNLVIKKYSSYKDIQNCHILIIPVSEKNNFDLILKKLDGKQVLTIGYSNGFAQRGVCINLIDYKGKIGFEINKKAIDKNKLKVSSQLLKLAKKIY